MSTDNLEYLARQVQCSVRKRKRKQNVCVTAELVRKILNQMRANDKADEAIVVCLHYRLSTDQFYTNTVCIRGNGLMLDGEILRLSGIKDPIRRYIAKHGSGKAFNDLVVIITKCL